MAGKKSELGKTGQTVAANVKRLREDKNLTYAELSRRLETIGRPIPVLGLSRVENGTRRVDVDDLMALAVVLEVSPSALLMPGVDAGSPKVDATGIPDPVPAQRLWNWALGLDLLPGVSRDPLAVHRFVKYSNPIEYNEAVRRQAAGKVSSHPVAVPRVAAIHQRAQQREVADAAVAAEYGHADGDD
ncbi:helix-turn-helix domain-containing protein [Nocardia farcinica]|uniref:helix-turn-helix domain-containing protein n=1 Tax=Nocardia farcinica TaxID=37329 RepID=UPI000BF8B8CB|nr:helix-turn-helix domain-containing protein [Nocardia farcinica]